jgi:CHAD domain-containing protein
VTDFLASDAIALEAAGTALAEQLPVRDRGVAEIERRFYDTFDGLLHAAGLTVVHEGGVMSIVELASGVERAAARVPAPVRPMLARELGPGRLREALLGVIHVRALLPVSNVRTRVHSFDVLDEAQKTVARVSLEQPALAAGAGGGERALSPRVRVGGVRGYDKARERVCSVLEHERGLSAAERSIVEEAVIAAGGSPSGTSSRVDVALAPEQRSDVAATLVLTRLLDVIRANLDGAADDIDSEFLHDLRVAVRRSRAVQRELRSVFAPQELAAFRGEFRWLQGATGAARDLDVYVLEFEATRALVPRRTRDDLGPVLAVLRARRRSAQDEMSKALRSPRASNLLTGWGAMLETLVELPLDDRPGATHPIGELAGERIRQVYKRMAKMGRALGPASPPDAYHELRKKGKELRYVLELFGTQLWPEEVVKPLIKRLKSLQDVLGRHQDREVQIATLRSLSDDVAATRGGPAALMAMGILTDRLSLDEHAARQEFAETFSEFANQHERKLVEETFT